MAMKPAPSVSQVATGAAAAAAGAKDKGDKEEDNPVLPKSGEFVNGVNHVYEVQAALGKGTFGAVFRVKRLADGASLAMKCETFTVKKQVLSMDHKVMTSAKEIKSQHFCFVEDKGRVRERFLFLVMKLVGKNIGELRIMTKERRFTMATSLRLAEQTLASIRDLHKIGFLHRDIKPQNFAVGAKETNEHHTVFILDFGLCRKFTADGKDLRLPRASAPYRGTTRYAPRAALLQVDQSRKDDCESWFYMIVEWTEGALPWAKFKGNERKEVLGFKDQVRNDHAAFNWLELAPKSEFIRIMTYVDGLQYNSIPDYDYIHFLLVHAGKAANVNALEALEWDPGQPYRGPPYVPERDVTKAEPALRTVGTQSSKKQKEGGKEGGGEKKATDANNN